MAERPLKVLLELRPAFDGHAGIPQETRLLFRALRRMEGIEAEGLIQSSGHVLAPGLPDHEPPGDRSLYRLSRVVISTRLLLYSRYLSGTMAALGSALGGTQQLGHFDPRHFRDFIWRSMFAKTLHASDFDSVTGAGFRVARVPWTVMHRCGLATRWMRTPLYPRLDTSNFDALIGETPYPGRVSPRTHLVIRYHDAIPLLMPHTIDQMDSHQASHYFALRDNVREGAHFACVSEATRKDLVGIFPQAEPRTAVIHNTISHHYFQAQSDASLVPEILATRANPELERKESRTRVREKPREANLDYLLIVSMIEPRKNHETLLAAWEQLRATTHPGLKLVVVGKLAWAHEAIKARLAPWVERGGVFAACDVPPEELRVLYRHARATVCPSFGEGFDFSGVEAMRCGGPVIASDIPVHREIFGNAAEYFSPYSSPDLAQAITALLDPRQPARREALVAEGATVSTRYLPDVIDPQWQTFLQNLPRN